MEATYEMDGELIEVGFAESFQESAKKSKVHIFQKEGDELKILKANPKEILVVKSLLVSSPKTIVDVQSYNDSLNLL